MPACPRSEIVRKGEVGVYHVWSRCVRRAFLCGTDSHTGKDFNYRRDWICAFEQQLAALFGLEICFHTELSNHIHLVLRARPDVVKTWTDEEVARRMMTAYRLVKSKDGKTIGKVTDGDVAMKVSDSGRIAAFRERLSNVSNFMQALCEHVALRANREDSCSGHFWEERFRARDLKNEAAVLVCGIYVDLNQIRAEEAMTPEESTHTSAYDRIRARKAREEGNVPDGMPVDGWLCAMMVNERSEAYEGAACSKTPWRASDKGILPIELDDYLRLLDSTGRIIREGKGGAIPEHLAPILDRLSINQDLWIDLVTKFDTLFGHVVGTAAQIADRAKKTGRHWYQGQAQCAKAFG